jgi:hypothetical protein
MILRISKETKTTLDTGVYLSNLREEGGSIEVDPGNRTKR